MVITVVNVSSLKAGAAQRPLIAHAYCDRYRGFNVFLRGKIHDQSMTIVRIPTMPTTWSTWQCRLTSILGKIAFNLLCNFIVFQWRKQLGVTL